MEDYNQYDTILEGLDSPLYSYSEPEQEHEATMEDLIRQVGEKSDHANKLLSQYQIMEQRLQDAIREQQRLESDLNLAKNEYSKLKKANISLKMSLTHSRAVAEKLTESLQQEQTGERSLRDERDHLRREIENLEDELEHLNLEKEDLSEQLKDSHVLSDQQGDEFRRTIEGLEEDVDRHEQEKQYLASQLTATQRECDDVKSAFSSLREAHTRLEEVVESRSREASEHLRLKELALKSVKEHERRSLSFENEIHKSQLAVEELERVQEELKGELRERQETCYQLEQRVLVLEEDKLNLSQALGEREADMASLRQEKEQLRKDFEANRKSHEKEVNTFMLEIARRDEEIVEKTEELRHEMESHEEEVREIQDQAMDEQDRVEEEAEELRAEVSRLHQLLDQATADKSNLFNSLEETIAKEDATAASLRASVDALQSELLQKEREQASALREKDRELEERRQAFYERGVKMTRVLTQLQQYVHGLKQESQQTKAVLSDLAAHFLMTTHSLHNTVHQLEEKKPYELYHEELERAFRLLVEQKRKAEADLMEQKDATLRVEMSVEEEKGRSGKLEEDVDKARYDLQEAEGRSRQQERSHKEELRRVRRMMEDERRKKSEFATKFDQAQDTIKKSRMSIRDLQQQSLTLQKQVSDVQASSQAKVDRMKQRIETLESDLRSMRQTNDGLIEKRSDLQTQLDLKEKEKNKLRANLRKLEGALHRLASERNMEQTRLSSEVKALSKTLNSSHQELRQTQTVLDLMSTHQKTSSSTSMLDEAPSSHSTYASSSSPSPFTPSLARRHQEMTETKTPTTTSPRGRSYLSSPRPSSSLLGRESLGEESQFF